MAPPLLALQEASLRLGPEPLIESLSAAIAGGDRICLVGRNGSGKSTLLRALAGEIELDSGSRFVKPGTTVAYLPQEPVFAPEASALDLVQAGLPPDRAEAAYAAEELLEGFGIVPLATAGTLSGGELRRVALARTLAADAEILLLDEPTNHLDIDTILKLETDLLGFRGALVLVSHDRAFLATLARTTWWLDRGQIRVLHDGFRAFDTWSAQILADEEAAAHRLDRALAAEAEWLRYGVTARRKRNQGRLQRLHAMRAERAARRGPEGRVRMEVGTAAGGSKLVVEAEGIEKTLGGRCLIAGFSTRILKGDRVGIVGPNGAGKTTLVKLLTGDLAPDAGAVRIGTSLEVATIEQRRESLDPHATPWSTLCPDGGDQVMVQGRARHVVGYLQDFLFRPEQARTPLRVLSGGERNRLLLAKQLARPCHLLVLDEPTNDLDMDTLDLLQERLADFEGTLLLVSHDRDFIDRLVTSVIACEGEGRWVEYAGGFSDMMSQRAAAGEVVSSVMPTVSKPAPPAAKKAAKAERSRRPERELERTMARIEALEGEIEALEGRLADADLFLEAPEVFSETTRVLEERRAELEKAEARWLELEDLIKAAP